MLSKNELSDIWNYYYYTAMIVDLESFIEIESKTNTEVFQQVQHLYESYDDIIDDIVDGKGNYITEDGIYRNIHVDVQLADLEIDLSEIKHKT